MLMICMYIQELSQKYLLLQQSKERTNIQVQTTIQSNPLGKSKSKMLLDEIHLTWWYAKPGPD